MLDVRGAVIEADRILLVRELTDGCWAVPGGYADIGLSAAQNIIKEIREEAGLTVTARALYSVTGGPSDADGGLRDHTDVVRLIHFVSPLHRFRA